nr:type II secretion system protein [Youxingia wuxianensis]
MVLAILGILAAVLIPTMLGFVDKSKTKFLILPKVQARWRRISYQRH